VFETFKNLMGSKPAAKTQAKPSTRKVVAKATTAPVKTMVKTTAKPSSDAAVALAKQRLAEVQQQIRLEKEKFVQLKNTLKTAQTEEKQKLDSTRQTLRQEQTRLEQLKKDCKQVETRMADLNKTLLTEKTKLDQLQLKTKLETDKLNQFSQQVKVSSEEKNAGLLSHLMGGLAKPKAAVSSLGLHVGINTVVPYSDYASTGERDAILASSGMGKSYLTGVLMEETLENKGLLCVIDPEGEHFTLAERYPMLIIGGEHAHLPIDDDGIELYVETMLSGGISLVFDLSEFLDEEQAQWYAKIAEAIFVAEQKHRRKVRIVVEEAQIYAPQRTGGGGMKRKTALDPVVVSQKLSKRGRKRAIDSLWATQRPASLNKDILSQCNRFWFGGITAEQDYKAVKPFLTEAGISFGQIKALQPGQFFLYGKGKTQLIQVRKRHCRHAGATPEAGATFQAVSNGSIMGVMEELQKEIARRTFKKREETSEAAKLKQVIHELEDENRQLKQELEEERMATRVIDRLGSSPEPVKPRSKRKTGGQRVDELVAELTEENPLRLDVPDNMAKPEPLPNPIEMTISPV
jgi:Helicase HerA, central domain